MRKALHGIGLNPAAARSAVVTVAAVMGACSTMWLIGGLFGAAASTAVMASTLAITMGRKVVVATVRDAVVPLVSVLVVALVATGVAWLLLRLPVVGAVVFVAGMSAAIWIRRFGPAATRFGTLISLPLIGILILPVASPATGSVPLDLAIPVITAGVVLVWVIGLNLAAVSIGFVPRTAAREPAGEKDAQPAGRRRLRPSTRMALQMATALFLAFVVGWLLFPGHWAWTVLTAYIVCAGNRGRADVVHKSLLRVAGAAGGTIAAFVLTAVWLPSGFTAIAIVFVVLYLGLWLRELSYAYWAVCVTLVLTLLQGMLGVADVSGIPLLAERLVAIAVGAVVGVAASWFLLPVRSSDVLRKRISEALVAVGEALAGANDSDNQDAAGRLSRVRARADAVARLAPAHVLYRRVVRLIPARRRAPCPADCIDLMVALPDALASFLDTLPAHTRKERQLVGAARRSLATPTDFTRIYEGLAAVLKGLTEAAR